MSTPGPTPGPPVGAEPGAPGARVSPTPRSPDSGPPTGGRRPRTTGSGAGTRRGSMDRTLGSTNRGGNQPRQSCAGTRPAPTAPKGAGRRAARQSLQPGLRPLAGHGQNWKAHSPSAATRLPASSIGGGWNCLRWLGSSAEGAGRPHRPTGCRPRRPRWSPRPGTPSTGSARTTGHSTSWAGWLPAERPGARAGGRSPCSASSCLAAGSVSSRPMTL